MHHAFNRDVRAAIEPLLKLKHAALKAANLSRLERARELYERALAAADAALPRDSLAVASSLLKDCLISRLRVASAITAHAPPGSADELAGGMLVASAWHTDAQLLRLSQRSLALLHSRWRAGSLFTLTPEEALFLADEEGGQTAWAAAGALLYIECAADAASLWPALHAPADQELRLHGVRGARQAALEVDARGLLVVGPALSAASLDLRRVTCSQVLNTVHRLELCVSMNRTLDGGVHGLRDGCRLSPAQEAALQQLSQRGSTQYVPPAWEDVSARMQACATADVARHGLRRCALPACDKTEAHPKLFKLCGRCRGAAYCCAEHSVQDWKRHKREDGCTPAAV
jgi:hypothetical protein